MNTQSNYNVYVTDEIRTHARKRARDFVDNETQFQLGALPTEQAHPYTSDFTATVQRDASEGVLQLLSVDGELPSIARNVVLRDSFDALVHSFIRTVRERRRVCFSGCGSTGRLSIMLEEMWRGFWEERAGVERGAAERSGEDDGADDILLGAARLACSIMTGGDRALIRSVENFEDYEQFGARQVADTNLKQGDLLVAISEGGETSSVIGTAREALRRGCKVVFLFNNPERILREQVERTRTLLDAPGATSIELFSGAMALSGSTRLQATTLEMVIVGIAMDEAFRRIEGTFDEKSRIASRLEAVNDFAGVIASLQRDENREVLGRLAQAEAETYEAGGRITYFARRYLLDIFCDTTERSPTFMLPPFRPFDDHESPPSWAFAKDPTSESDEAWRRMLRRAPRGLDWSADDYLKMDAPEHLVAHPPTLDRKEIARYHIGSEQDPSRYQGVPSLYITITVSSKSAPTTEPIVPSDGENGRELHLLITDGEPGSHRSPDEEVLSIRLPQSVINLWHHVAVKLIFNSVSTATMGIMQRIRRNWMVQVDPTNKKLIDRGSRIIAQIAGIPYEDACFELFTSLGARRVSVNRGEATTISPVVAALERLGYHQDDKKRPPIDE
jgi:N-acetylmuramic acid 6-phosphate etherase